MNEHEERTYQHNHGQKHQYRSNHAGLGKHGVVLPVRPIHSRVLRTCLKIVGADVRRL